MRAICVGLLLTLVIGCAGNTPPQTTVAHYTGTVLTAATELQRGITSATDAKLLPVPIAQQLTGYMDVVYQRSGPLLESLRVYNAATTMDVKKLKAVDIQKAIADINGALGSLLSAAIPQGALTEISRLVGNVMLAVGAVQAEVAKGLGS